MKEKCYGIHVFVNHYGSEAKQSTKCLVHSFLAPSLVAISDRPMKLLGINQYVHLAVFVKHILATSPVSSCNS